MGEPRFGVNGPVRPECYHDLTKNQRPITQTFSLPPPHLLNAGKALVTPLQ